MPANTTAAPLAASLGLVPNPSCGMGDNASHDCVGYLLKKYAKNSTQSILVIWDSNETDNLLEHLDLELPGQWHWACGQHHWLVLNTEGGGCMAIERQQVLWMPGDDKERYGYTQVPRRDMLGPDHME
ncbi:hypothetical protein DFH08DRAFT_811908 [Mycena albidolilacea]|uniref:Uncharacterized protein n=1 Tax=Mycena albidolilacea TaxID=1033008 RepID=A0AAD6ZUV8_9AGAR|nr:hypothetical protein DFH08DRAFT_811908 [Mycena albidolilacea]